jgi:hypothetical protein
VGGLGRRPEGCGRFSFVVVAFTCCSVTSSRTLSLPLSHLHCSKPQLFVFSLHLPLFRSTCSFAARLPRFLTSSAKLCCFVAVFPNVIWKRQLVSPSSNIFRFSLSFHSPSTSSAFTNTSDTFLSTPATSSRRALPLPYSLSASSWCSSSSKPSALQQLRRLGTACCWTRSSLMRSA